ncbi:MAG: hypothetical protein GY751_24690 [Bacteroidetes bacterium]|nr:hypothetical protein [Bacteroidota bacterium]
MKPKHVYLSNLTNDHKTWVSELQLQKDQVEIFEHRLGDVLQRNSELEVRAFGEQFQNKMIRQREVIDILNHDIKMEQHKLEEFAKDHPIAIEHIYFQDHRTLRERVFVNTDIFKAFRREFYGFIEKWL